MNVPSKSDDPQRRSRRGHAALALLWLIASAAHAVDYDEKLQAPRVKNPTELRNQAQSYTARFSELQAVAPETPVSDPALFRARADLAWQIQRAIDARTPLGDLSVIGLESTGDGAYRLDFAKSPQWDRLDRVFIALFSQANWDLLGQQLVARGFRPEDVTTLKDYVLTHDGHAVARQRALPYSLAFSRLVKKLDKIKRPVTDDLVFSYLYQRDRAYDEALREWADGLLKSLDPQRGRILISYVAENPGFGIWAPSDPTAGIASLLANVRLPDFERRVTEESRGVTP
jgi:hypothetical protein